MNMSLTISFYFNMSLNISFYFSNSAGKEKKNLEFAIVDFHCAFKPSLTYLPPFLSFSSVFSTAKRKAKPKSNNSHKQMTKLNQQHGKKRTKTYKIEANHPKLHKNKCTNSEFNQKLSKELKKNNKNTIQISGSSKE